jgi:hypothetical protein
MMEERPVPDQSEYVQLTWSFAVKVTDEMKLREAKLDLVSDQGEIVGVMDFDLETIVAYRLQDLMTSMRFWETAKEVLGLEHHHGIGLHPRLRHKDGSYPAQSLPAMNADGTLALDE